MWGRPGGHSLPCACPCVSSSTFNGTLARLGTSLLQLVIIQRGRRLRRPRNPRTAHPARGARGRLISCSRFAMHDANWNASLQSWAPPEGRGELGWATALSDPAQRLGSAARTGKLLQLHCPFYGMGRQALSPLHAYGAVLELVVGQRDGQTFGSCAPTTSESEHVAGAYGRRSATSDRERERERDSLLTSTQPACTHNPGGKPTFSFLLNLAQRKHDRLTVVIRPQCRRRRRRPRFRPSSSPSSTASENYRSSRTTSLPGRRDQAEWATIG